MSVSGMKKQLHKASQLLNEKLMGAEGTRMDDDFLKMEKSVSVIHALLVELLSRTTEFLQPNPATRAKLSMLSTVSRLRGHERSSGYPQTECMLGECMQRYGEQLGAGSEFGGALEEVGGALQQVAQARDELDANVKRSFIDPLQELQSCELKEIRHHLKKLSGRRLDLDYKRRRRGKVLSEDLHEAWNKFYVSKEEAELSMFTLLQEPVDRIRSLAALVAALLQFHQHAQRILLGLHGDLQARLTAASNRPVRRFRSRKIRVRSEQSGSIRFYQQTFITAPAGEQQEAPPLPRSPAPYDVCGPAPALDRPCCRAVYSFQPSAEGELRLSQGDLVLLTGQADANWFEGELGGRAGIFPVSYVEVLVPLPLP